MGYRTTLSSGHVLIMEDPCGEDDWVSKNVMVLCEALKKPDLAHFTKAVFASDIPVIPSISISGC